MRIRFFLSTVLGAALLYSPWLSPQTAPETVPPTYGVSVLMVMGVVVAAAVGFWFFTRVRQPSANRQAGAIPPVGESPRLDFRKHIGDLVQRCDAVIAIIGNQWVSSQPSGVRRLDDARDLVRIEIASALARGIPVVPVLVGGAVMPTGEELPDEIQGLSYRNGISVRPDPDFHKDLDRLIAGIDAHFGRH